MRQQKIQEITLLELKHSELSSLNEMNVSLRNGLSKKKGFIQSFTFQSLDQPNLILEIAEWESIKHAKKGSRVFVEEQLDEYINAIQRILYFDYAIGPTGQGTYDFNHIKDSDILEFAYGHSTNRELELYRKSREPLFTYLEQRYDALNQATTMQSAVDPLVLIDFMHWKDLEACYQAQKELESHELFQNVIQYMDLTKAFSMNLFYHLN